MASGVVEAGGESAPSEVALFPLNAVLFPDGPLPLRIFEPRYIDMVRRCMREGSPFGVVLILDGAEAGAPVERMASVGTSARITDFYPLPDGLLGIFCMGGRRFQIVRRWRQDDGLHVAEVRWLAEESRVPLPPEHQHLGALMQRVLPELGELYESVETRADDAGWVACRLAEILPVGLTDKQRWLEIDDPLQRLGELAPLIRRDQPD